MKTLMSVSNIHFLIFIILVQCMWNSLGEKQSKKNCVSPCRIFHRWCKNEGKCREKGLDCTWYCECPKNCTGFFCEKIIPLDELGSNGQKVVVKVTYEREKKKDVTAFDKSKLAQALAGIMKVKQTDEEKKTVLPETIDRVGKTINIKENVTAHVTIICQPGELASNYQKNLSTVSSTPSATTNTTPKQNNLKMKDALSTLKNNTTNISGNIENSPIIITHAIPLAVTPTTLSPIVKSSFVVESSIDSKPTAKQQTVASLQKSTDVTQTTASTKTEVNTSITPFVGSDVSTIKNSIKQNLTTIGYRNEGLLTRLTMPPPPVENSLYRKATNEIKTENKPTLLDIIEKSIAVELIATQKPEYRTTLTTAFVPVDKNKTTTEITVNISTPKMTESYHQPTGVTEFSNKPTGATEFIHQPTGVTESTHQRTSVTESTHQPTGVTESSHRQNGVTEFTHQPTGVTESYQQQTTDGTSRPTLIDFTASPTPIMDHNNNNTNSVAAARITITTIKSIQSKNMSTTTMQVSAESNKIKVPITHSKANNVNKSVSTIIDRSSKANIPNKRGGSIISTTVHGASTTASPVKSSMEPARTNGLSSNNQTAEKAAEYNATTKHISSFENVMTTEETKINRATTPPALSRNELVISHQTTSKSVTDTPESSIHGQKEVTRDVTTSIPTNSIKAKKVDTRTEGILNKTSEITTRTTKIVSTTVQSIKSEQDFNDHQSKQTHAVQTSTNLSSDKKIVTGDINIRSPTSVPSLNVTAVAITSHDVPSATEMGTSTSPTNATIVSTVSTTEGRTDATTSTIAVTQSQIHDKIKKAPHTTSSQIMYSSTPKTVKAPRTQSTSSSNLKQMKKSPHSFANVTEKPSTHTPMDANARTTISRKTGTENNRKSTIDHSITTTQGSVLAKNSDHVDSNENGQNMTTSNLNFVNTSIKKQTVPIHEPTLTNDAIKHTTTSTLTVTQSQKHDQAKTASERTTSTLTDPSTFETQAIKTTNTHSDTSRVTIIDESTPTTSESNNLNSVGVANSTRSTKANSHDNFETSTIVSYKINSTKTSIIKTGQATTDVNKNVGKPRDTATSNIVSGISSQISESKTLQKPKKDDKVAQVPSINAMISANERRIIPSPSNIHMHDMSESKLVLTKEFLDRKSDVLSTSKVKNELLTNTLNESVKDLKFDLLKMQLHETGHPSDIDNIL